MMGPRGTAGGWLLSVLLVGGGGCGASQAWDQTPVPVSGVPESFALDPARAPAPTDSGCAVHLQDQKAGAKLELVRSATIPSGNGVTTLGDYRLEPPGSYGMAPSQLLRVECPSRRPLGAVH
jgi:hypothetical protein